METKPVGSIAPVQAGAPSRRWDTLPMPFDGPALVDRMAPDTRSLRVAVFSDALKDRNGVDAYYRDLICHLRPWVDTIDLLSPNPKDGDLRSFLAMPLPGDSTQQVIFPHLFRLYRRIQAIRPNVVISATNGPFGIIGIQVARHYDAPFLAGFHTHIEGLCEMYWSTIVGGVTRRFMESQNRLLFHYARTVVVNSHRMRESAAALSRTPVAVVGTPIAHPFLHTPVRRPAPSLKRVFFAGRLAMEKNIFAVIEAARHLPELRFTIAGDGPLREPVEAAANRIPNLEYVGHVAREKMVDLIDAHDLLVLPSDLEAFGTIALEAMARQRLVLVSRHCGILSWPELSKGIYHFGGDETLADAINRIAAIDPPLREKKAREARKAAIALNQAAIAQWLDLLSGDRRLQPERH